MNREKNDISRAYITLMTSISTTISFSFLPENRPIDRTAPSACWYSGGADSGSCSLYPYSPPCSTSFSSWNAPSRQVENILTSEQPCLKARIKVTVGLVIQKSWNTCRYLCYFLNNVPGSLQNPILMINIFIL